MALQNYICTRTYIIDLKIYPNDPFYLRDENHNCAYICFALTLDCSNIFFKYKRYRICSIQYTCTIRNA